MLEDPAEAFGGPRVDRVQRRVQPAADTQHLLEEALEEDCVAGLVSDLGGEEDALVLTRGRVKERGERVGDGLLADEEKGHGVLGDLLDPGRQALPVRAVLSEVEVRDRPLLLLPAPVERRGIDVRCQQAVHLGLDLVDRDADQVLQRRRLDVPHSL